MYDVGCRVRLQAFLSRLESNEEEEEGSDLRLIDFCITQLEAQGPSRTFKESREER